MKTPILTPSTGASIGVKSDHTKLLSLLALATGAVALPQTSDADIIYTDLSSNPAQIGFAPTAATSFIINTLPGLAQLGFGTRSNIVTTLAGAKYYQTVRVDGMGSGAGVNIKINALGFAAANSAGLRWGQMTGATVGGGIIGYAMDFNHNPNSFTHRYLAFEFADTTLAGNPLRFGWVDMSLTTGNVANSLSNPTLTVFGYAYDNTGAQIPMGLVPEPGSMTIMALGALMMGAKGLRSWRRNRNGANQP
jgi:hypothetical protein